MSCNGCRVLRKGCSESCVLRPCLKWIENPEAQGHATVFVAKFFGRAGLMNFITNVPEPQRPALFRSLLFEACGRTINPVNGAVGLLWAGNWCLCQAAVDTVLRGGALRALPELSAGGAGALYDRQPAPACGGGRPACDLDLCLTPQSAAGEEEEKRKRRRRPATPSMGESVTTSAESGEKGQQQQQQQQPGLLNLFY